MEDAKANEVEEFLQRSEMPQIELLDWLGRSENAGDGFVGGLQPQQTAMARIHIEKEAVLHFQEARLLVRKGDFEVKGRIRPIVVKLGRVINRFDFGSSPVDLYFEACQDVGSL